MRSKISIKGVGALAGVIGFAGIVLLLQLLNPTYDPMNQHISELALARYGSLMLVAFLCFGYSVFCIQQGLAIVGANQIIKVILNAAAFCLAGAGIFKLSDAPVAHVALIALAFILLVLTMYLLPQVASFGSRSARLASWGLAAGTALSVASGGILPDGVAQRIAAACILGWLFWMGLRLIRHQ